MELSRLSSYPQSLCLSVSFLEAILLGGRFGSDTSGDAVNTVTHFYGHHERRLGDLEVNGKRLGLITCGRGVHWYSLTAGHSVLKVWVPSNHGEEGWSLRWVASGIRASIIIFE